MKIERVSIIGLGALGTMFGHHLSKHMPAGTLKIVADEKRIERYRRQGVFSNGERCSFDYITPKASCPPADLVIFAVKFYALRDAIAAVKNHVGPNTLLLSLLNGISSETVISETYGTDRVLDCVSLGMDAVKEGNFLTYHNMGQLSIGERGSAPTEKTHRVADFFERTQLPYDIAEDMNRRMWGKFMTNVGVNQAIAVYETDYGAVQREGKERDTMIAAMREVIALSEKEGVFLTEDDLSHWLSILQTLSPGGKPSMRQDLEAKRPTELELFGGTVVELGRKHGIATPVNLWLVQKIHEIEKSFHH